MAFPITDGLLFGARVDATTLTGTWGMMMAGRLDYFPIWWPFHGLTPAHFVSFLLEGGALVVDAGNWHRPAPFFTLGLALWPRFW